MNKQYNLETVFSALKKKKIKATFNGLVYIIDLKDAENIGNKTWGKIEYLIRFHDVQVINKNVYMHKNDEIKEKSGFIVREVIMKTNCITK